MVLLMWSGATFTAGRLHWQLVSRATSTLLRRDGDSTVLTHVNSGFIWHKCLSMALLSTISRNTKKVQWWLREEFLCFLLGPGELWAADPKSWDSFLLSGFYSLIQKQLIHGGRLCSLFKRETQMIRYIVLCKINASICASSIQQGNI